MVKISLCLSIAPSVHGIVELKGSESLPSAHPAPSNWGLCQCKFCFRIAILCHNFRVLWKIKDFEYRGVCLRHQKSRLYSIPFRCLRWLCLSWTSSLKVNPQHFLSKYPLFFENSYNAEFISHLLLKFSIGFVADQLCVCIWDTELGHHHFGLLTWVILTLKPSNQPWLPGKTRHFLCSVCCSSF